MSSMPPFPPIDVLLLRERECDALQMMLEDERKRSSRILAQRDRLAELLRDARKYVVYETFAHDESPADKVLERIEVALAELDKEKQQ